MKTTIKSKIKNTQQPISYPLTKQQEGLWFNYKFDPKSTSYNTYLKFYIKKGLDLQRFKKAVNMTCTLFSSFRTKFIETNSGIVKQVIYPNLKGDIIKYEDISQNNNFNAQARHKLALKKVNARRKIPFKLDSQRGYEVYLIKYSDQDYIFMTQMHHILVDGQGALLLGEAILLAYNGGEKALKQRFKNIYDVGDYLNYYNNSTQQIKTSKEYWKNRLKGARLNIDIAARNKPGFSMAEKRFSLGKKRYKMIKQYARRNKTTPFLVLSTIYAVLLYRYFGQKDMSIGYLANIKPANLKDMFGYYVSLYPLRIAIEAKDNFKSLITKITSQQKQDRKHFHLSADQIINLIHKDYRNDPKNFGILVGQAMFVNKSIAMDGVDISMEIGTEMENRDLGFLFNLQTEELDCKLHHNSNIFTTNTISQIIQNYRNLVDRIIEEEEKEIDKINYITKQEQQKLISYNNTQADYPQDKTIHQLFEEQVTKTPNNIAVVFEDQELTYQELNEKANKLAHYLQSLKVQPDDLVGIYLDRSLEMIIGILGILKAGGAYVPLDPEYPQDRIKYMIEDCKVKIILTIADGLKSSLLNTNNKTELVCLDKIKHTLIQAKVTNPVMTARASNLAYVIYTSGSTGRPKGIIIEHRSLCNFIDWMQKEYKMDSNDSVLQKIPFSFDASGREFHWPLAFGAKMVMATAGKHKDLEYLIDLISKKNITILHFVPSMLQAFLNSKNDKKCQSIKIIYCGGEVLTKKQKNSFFSIYKNQELYNLYGPTEATIDATYYKCQQHIDTIPIGRPIQNTQIYILDQYNQLTPEGIYGELHIAGAGLARSYLNKPKLTKEKFIQNPFASNQDKKLGINQRLYKSGDLARWLPDGNIEYLGRIDTQVKIRGFRIELGEIESNLSQHQKIQEAVVIAKDNVGNKQLIAYYVAKNTVKKKVVELDIEEIRNHLKKHLPDYMIPSGFISLDKIPLTLNGKIDRKLLEQRDVTLISSKEYVAPRNQTESILAKIFSEVLGINKVGIYDNFFELGGHSLLATKVISRIRNKFKIVIELRSLFQEPTIAGIAKIVATSNIDNLLPLVIQKRPKKIPLSFSQERLWFLDQLEDNPRYNIPGVIKIKGKLDKDKLRESFQEIVKRHEILRTNFKIEEKSAYQVISDRTELDYQEATQANIYKIKEFINKDTHKPFNLSKDRLLRVRLFSLDKNDHILYVKMHHIVSDGWSIGIFLKEVSIIYNALLDNKKISLPPLPIQYADYSIWQRKVLNKKLLNKQLSYWQKHLQGYSNINLPTDYSRPKIQSGKGNSISLNLSQELTQRLRKYSKEKGYTMYMLSLAGLYILLRRYSNQTDICIGSPIANRHRKEVESLIGFFINSLALRINLQNVTIETLLQKVKEITLKSYEYQDTPFEKVVERMQPTRDLSKTPIFQVMLTDQNTLNHQIKLGETKIETTEPEYNISKFDLDISISDTKNLNIVISYSTDLYKKETIERLLGHYEKILENIIKNQALEIDKINYITKQEYQKLISYNNTRADYTQDKTIHQLFEQQVIKTPNNIAVVFEDQKLTYQELNEKANKLAHYLQSLEVRPDDLVGIYLDRSLKMIIGILGILKAGGAYVPLDPDYPKKRISYMIEDSKAKILLTTEELKDNLLKTDNQIEIICLDKIEQQLIQAKVTNPAITAKADNLAYVMYTSGSTGIPKGVMIEHHNTTAFIDWTHKIFSSNELKAVLASTSLTFDLSIFEIFSPLTIGGSSYIVKNTLALINNADKYPITLVNTVPSAILALLKENSIPRTVTTINLIGELLKQDLVEQIYKIKHINKVYDLYGPAEDTTYSTFTLRYQGGTTTIGKPISNTQIYILDQHNQLTPEGILGELHIAGAGLARGYLNKPELTKEKFIQNPFASNQDRKLGINQRLYKSGDLARWLPDGNIEYLGRIDTQVKIRGFRIELGEIENNLSKHQKIQEAVVIAKNNQLMAYYVAKNTIKEKIIELDIEEIRNYLKKYLPDYMIPFGFISLDKIPLTPNGKIDRKLLEQRDVTLISSKEYVAPGNQTELILARIFSEVLGIKENKVGIYDNFFELGGHSLLVIHLVNKIHSIFNRDVNLPLIFQHPVINELAKILVNTKYNLPNNSNMIPLQPKGKYNPIFFVGGMGGHSGYFINLANLLGKDQPCYGLNSPGYLKGDKYCQTIEDLAKYYISLIGDVQKTGPYYLAGHSFGALVVFEMAYQLEQQEDEVALVVNIDGSIANNIIWKQKDKIKSKNLEYIKDLEQIMDILKIINGEDDAKKFNIQNLHNSLIQLSVEERDKFVRQKLIELNIASNSLPAEYIEYIIKVFCIQKRIYYQIQNKKIKKMIYFKAQKKLKDQSNNYWNKWKKYSNSKLQVITVSGDHMTMVQPPYVQDLAAKLYQALKSSRERIRIGSTV